MLATDVARGVLELELPLSVAAIEEALVCFHVLFVGVNAQGYAASEAKPTVPAFHKNRVGLVIATDEAACLVAAFALLPRLLFFREL